MDVNLAECLQVSVAELGPRTRLPDTTSTSAYSRSILQPNGVDRLLLGSVFQGRLLSLLLLFVITPYSRPGVSTARAIRSYSRVSVWVVCLHLVEFERSTSWFSSQEHGLWTLTVGFQSRLCHVHVR